MTSAQIERDFGAAALCCTLVLPFNCGQLVDKFFQAQLIALLTWATLVAPEDMPLVGMCEKDANAKLPEDRFGIPSLYEGWDDEVQQPDGAEEGHCFDADAAAACDELEAGPVWASEEEDPAA